MQPATWEGPSPARHQSNIRQILEQVKSGQKSKSDAFSELRGILNTSAGKGLGLATASKGEEEEAEEVFEGILKEEGKKLNPDNNQINTPSRFSQEDRKVLINKLIENKRRNELENKLSSELNNASKYQQEYQSNGETYNISSQYQEGQEERKWGQENLEGDRRYDEEDRGDAREEKGPPGHSHSQSPPPSPPASISSHSSISGATRSQNHSRPTTQPQYRSNEMDERDYQNGNSIQRSYNTNYDIRTNGFGSGDNNEEGFELNGYDNNPSYSYPYSANANEMFFSDARSNRMVQNEASIREEMFRECTFQPKIKELPLAYGVGKDVRGSREGPFYDRVIRWKEAKAQEASVKKQQVDRTHTIDCTFHPRMNRNSERAIKEIRGHGFDQEDPVSVGERLYRNSEAVYMMRAKAIEEELKKERNEEGLECTFQPTLVSDNGKYSQVKSKFNHVQTRRAEDDLQQQNDRLMRACTFTPKVKGIGARMASAKLYVSTDVVERLTRSGARTQGERDMTFEAEGGYRGEGDRPVMDASSYLGSQSGSQFDPQTPRGRDLFTPGSASTNRRRSSSAPRRSSSFGSSVMGYDDMLDESRRSRTDDNLTAEEIREREARFQQFLGRQQQSALRNAQHLRTMVTSSKPKFRPSLCRKSLEMSEQHFKGEFLDRVERDVLRRSDYEQKLSATGNTEYCSFQPSILEKSEKLRGRSVYEMSRGDLLR
jgi:hypothetical protein